MRDPKGRYYRGGPNSMSPGDGTGMDNRRVPVEQWSGPESGKQADSRGEVQGIEYGQQRKEPAHARR